MTKKIEAEKAIDASAWRKVDGKDFDCFSSSRRRHTRSKRDWSSDVCSSDLPAGYSPDGHARFYEQVRQALALPKVLVLGHSFGATTALTYAALFPESTAMCVAVAAFGIGPDTDAREGGEAEAAAEALLARHAGSPWYEAARPVMDSWTERLLAATDAAEMEQM